MATELLCLRNATQTWIGSAVSVASGGSEVLEIREDAVHLIDMMEEYGIDEFWGLVDIEILPLEARSVVWHVSTPAFIVDTGVNVGVQFVLSSDIGANGPVTFFVKVRVPHTKTN